MTVEQRTRLSLHQELCDILGAKDRVYFEPPSHMKYPCIRYEDSGEEINYGDNVRYHVKRRWMVMIIDQDPDSELPMIFMEHFPYCRKDRVYATDGLYHFVFDLFY